MSSVRGPLRRHRLPGATDPSQDLCTVVQTIDTGIDDPPAIEKLLLAFTNAVEKSPTCH